MSLSHYFELTPERYMRTYYGFPTFYNCTNPPSNINVPTCFNTPLPVNPHPTEPCCINHINYMVEFSNCNTFLNK